MKMLTLSALIILFLSSVSQAASADICNEVGHHLVKPLCERALLDANPQVSDDMFRLCNQTSHVDYARACYSALVRKPEVTAFEIINCIENSGQWRIDGVNCINSLRSNPQSSFDPHSSPSL